MLTEVAQAGWCHCRRGSRWRASVCALSLAAAAGTALAQENPLQPSAPPPRAPEPEAPPPPPPPAPQPEVDEGLFYEVSAFVLRYANEHPDRPPLDELMNLEVTLGIVDGAYVSARPGEPTVTLSIGDLTSAQRARRRFSGRALTAVADRIVRELNRRGIVGVLVAADPEQIDPENAEDLRPPEIRTLRLDIWTRSLQEIRTLGAGGRWTRSGGSGPSVETRINNPRHSRIRDNSPLRPASEGHSGDLLRKDLIDNYLFSLNRHPGRRVDAAIASAGSPGDVILDYIVTENRPWTVYFQLSNTGTKQTDEWRERFGFVHNQLTNRDDILSIDYITAGFDEANAVVGSYEMPLGRSDLFRVKGYGSYSEFTASDVGFSNERFVGDSWTGGGELIAAVFQRRELFIDLFGGARWEHHHVSNEAVNVEGTEDFFIPYAGARLERTTLISTTSAEVRVEASVPSVSGVDQDEIDRLGRLFVDDDWTVLKWSATHAFYIEPLLASADGSGARTSLAHEVAVGIRGQYAFGGRLIPQAEDVVGGLYTVRGYTESLVAGDNSIIGTAEYRFHLPRALSVREPGTLFGKSFRYAPDQPYGRPDWDLILRGFVDAARVTNSDRQSFEQDETLIGTGIGAELVFRRNLNIRIDWGIALEDAADVDAGDNRVHFVATLLY